MAAFIDLFDIQLISGSAQLRPGETIVGSVLIRVRNDGATFRQLRVEFTGEAKTAWIAQRSDKIFETSEPYLNHTIDLSDSLIERIEPGFHAIPFTHTLPNYLPASFEGEFGYIRYSCAAVLIVSFQGGCLPGTQDIEITCEKLLTVVDQTQQHGKPSLQIISGTPITKETTIEAVGCMGRLGSIEMKLTIARSNYYVGDMIYAEVIIRNISRQKVKSVTLSLMQNSKFEALSVYESISDSKDVLRTIDSTCLSKAIQPLDELKWNPRLLIPATAPSFETKWICVKYFLRLSIPEGEICIPLNLTWLNKQNNNY